MSIRSSQGTQSGLRAYPDKLDGLLNVIAELLAEEAVRESISRDFQGHAADSSLRSTLKTGGANA